MPGVDGESVPPFNLTDHLHVTRCILHTVNLTNPISG